MRELKSNKAIKEIFPGAETSGAETSSAETAALNCRRCNGGAEWYPTPPTAHTTGPIMTKPDMMMVPNLGMVHTIFQGQGQRLRSYFVRLFINSPT